VVVLGPFVCMKNAIKVINQYESLHPLNRSKKLFHHWEFKRTYFTIVCMEKLFKAVYYASIISWVIIWHAQYVMIFFAQVPIWCTIYIKMLRDLLKLLAYQKQLLLTTKNFRRVRLLIFPWLWHHRDIKLHQTQQT